MAHAIDFKELLDQSAERHRKHLCPRQVLGVRMGLYALELLGLERQNGKRLFAFVESDGCMTDGIGAATGCWWGSRTMYLIDYGKTAATFVNSVTGEAIRIRPSPAARQRASRYAPEAPDRWHAQLTGYQVMPIDELLEAERVQLRISLQSIISRHGLRVVCEECGEDVTNQRQVYREGRLLCRACAGDAYYAPQGAPYLEVPVRVSDLKAPVQGFRLKVSG